MKTETIFSLLCIAVVAAGCSNVKRDNLSSEAAILPIEQIPEASSEVTRLRMELAAIGAEAREATNEAVLKDIGQRYLWTRKRLHDARWRNYGVEDVQVNCECRRSNDTLVVSVTYTNSGKRNFVIDQSGTIGPLLLAYDTRDELAMAYTNVWIPVTELREGLSVLAPGDTVCVSYDLVEGQKLLPSRAGRRYLHGGVPTALGLKRSVTNVSSVANVTVRFRKKESRDDSIRVHFGKAAAEVLGADVFGWREPWHTNLSVRANLRSEISQESVKSGGAAQQ